MPKDATQKSATLHGMVMADHMCPYRLKAQDWLERHGFVVEDHHLNNREEVTENLMMIGMALWMITKLWP